MLVIRGLDAFRPLARPAAVAVGNFDGLHAGHRKILRRLKSVARAGRLYPLVLTFYPHPERALGQRSVRMIDTLDQRLARLAEAGVKAVVVAPFDRSFARLDERAFAGKILSGRLRARAVVVGRDFRFGRGRRGDVAELRRLGRAFGFRVHAVPPKTVGGKAASSSAVRALLEKGRVGEAARVLGRPYEISGKVVGGYARGRKLGFPTANVETENEILPDGIYVTETVVRGKAFPSVTSIGTSPTFGRNPVRVETHLLRGGGRLYGARVAVRLLERIRATRKFRGPEALAARIAADVAEAAAHFGLEI